MGPLRGTAEPPYHLKIAEAKAEETAMRVIGLMSGTSLDGVDAAGLETDGEYVTERGPNITIPYGPDLVRDLVELLAKAPLLTRDDPFLADVTERLTGTHIEAVRALNWPADLIGFHGQTILHRPEHGRTWQIGDAAMLGRAFDVPVAFDFRSEDVAQGGQGAPLVPVYHQALVLSAGLDLPVAVVNIGGVANITLVMEGHFLACDTGPGNALIDDFCARAIGERMDRDGALALRGVPNEARVAQALASNPYFALPPPKSLDRNDFHDLMGIFGGLSAADTAASLVELTVRAITGTKLPEKPAQVLVCGGGRHNKAMMAALRTNFGVPVAPVEAYGFDGDALEAECFGFLAARVWRGLPISFPSTTGVVEPLTGGQIFYP